MSELTLLHVAGNGATAIGYGRLGVKLAAALTSIGIDVYDDMDSPAAPSHLDRQVEGKRHKKTNVACWVSTPGHARGWWEGQHAGLFSMWEATRLPEGYREHLHEFDTIVVPSVHNVELFGRHHPNVRLAHLGVDTQEWCYRKRLPPGQFFTFLCGGSGPRKGGDIVANAFRKVFPAGSWGDGPIPRLVLKSPKGEDIYGDRIEQVNGRLSAEAEVDLYAQAHCYVQPSRGEGFGLQPLQAMAQGCPTILTGAHGHASFAHLGMPVSATMTKAAYFIYGDAGEWWEPSLAEVCEWMEHVYLHYDEACNWADVSAEIVARDFTWENTARNFVAAFDGELARPANLTGRWYTPTQKLYPVVLLQDWTADIAGDRYVFARGETYYEHADVKRILFEANLLDPCCLEQVGPDGETDLDSGLTPSQVERIGAYSARNGFCPTCAQRLGSQPTRADELMAELDAEAAGLPVA